MKLKEARKAAGLRQQQLAEQSGISVRQIQRIEAGLQCPGHHTAAALGNRVWVSGNELREGFAPAAERRGVPL